MDILSTDKCIGDGYHFKEANIIYSRWMLLLGFVDANLKYSVRPGTEGFTSRKWIIGYKFGIDDGAESKFNTHKELIVLNIFKYKYCVDKSRDVSRDHFAKNRKLLTNW